MRDCVKVVETLMINLMFCSALGAMDGLSRHIAGDGGLWPLADFVVTTTISLIDYIPPRAH